MSNFKGDNITKKVLLPLLFILLLFSSAIFAVPETISVQGLLKDDAGTTLTGDHNFVFRIYDDNVATVLLWSEDKTLTVDDGIWNTRVGDVNTSPRLNSLDFNSGLFLELTINGEIQSPLLQLDSTATAFTSDIAIDLDPVFYTRDHNFTGTNTFATINADDIILTNDLIVVNDLNVGNNLLVATGFIGIAGDETIIQIVSGEVDIEGDALVTGTLFATTLQGIYQTDGGVTFTSPAEGILSFTATAVGDPTDLTIDLDGIHPVIRSLTDFAIEIAEPLIVPSITITGITQSNAQVSLGTETLTADQQNNANFFGDGTLAQSGNFSNEIKIFGGGSQGRHIKIFQDYDGHSFIGNSGGGAVTDLIFQTRDLNRVRIDADGNFVVGSDSTPYRFTMVSGDAVTKFALISTSGAVNNETALIFKNQPTPTTVQEKAGIFFVADESGSNRGDLIFALENTNDATNVTSSNGVLTLEREGTSIFSSDLTLDGSNAQLNLSQNGDLNAHEGTFEGAVKVRNADLTIGDGVFVISRRLVIDLPNAANQAQFQVRKAGSPLWTFYSVISSDTWSFFSHTKSADYLTFTQSNIEFNQDEVDLDFIVNSDDPNSLVIDGGTGVSTFGKNVIMDEDLNIGGNLNGGRNVFSAYTNANSATFTTNLVDLNFDVEIRDDSHYTHSTVTNNHEITVNETGDYMVQFDCTIDVSSGSARSGARCYLVDDGIEVDGSRCYPYNRLAGGAGINTCSFNRIVNITGGSVIKVQVTRNAGSDTLIASTDGSRITMEWYG